MTARACVCGVVVIDAYRCDACTTKAGSRVRHDQHARRSWRWRRLSERLRQSQPWCTSCGSTDDLTVDHVVPLSMGGKEYDVDNLRVLCRPCHGRVWAEQQQPRTVTGAVTGEPSGGLTPRGRRSLRERSLSEGKDG
jgi:5-methylcytosine-specific restriction protein A